MNNLSDFYNGVGVIWDLRDGQYVTGEVKWVSSAGNIGVQWQDEPEGTVYDYHYLDEHLIILKKNKELNTEVKDTEVNQNSTEDRIKNLIVHLIAVDLTDCACDVIEVLKKYKNTEAIKRYNLK